MINRSSSSNLRYLTSLWLHWNQRSGSVRNIFLSYIFSCSVFSWYCNRAISRATIAIAKFYLCALRSRGETIRPIVKAHIDCGQDWTWIAASRLQTQGAEELFVTSIVDCSWILRLIPRIAFVFILKNRANQQGAHTICLCSQLLFYSKCPGFTVCLIYTDISLTIWTMYINQL